MEITIVMSFGPVVEIKNGKNLQKEKRNANAQPRMAKT